MLSDCHILVAEESETLGLLIEEVLLRAGAAEVTLVSSTEAALVAIAVLPDRPGNLALIGRYVLGGWREPILAALRARHIPMVVDSASDLGPDAGVVVLPKPFGAMALVEALRAALSTKVTSM